VGTGKSILIVGGSGFVGTHLATRLREGYKVFASYYTKPIAIPGVTFIPMDASNKEWIKRVVYTVNPDTIIYAGGSNSVDWAEANPRDAERVHTGGPATVSNVSEILQSKFIFLSNCYTFDGAHGNYHEADTAMPPTTLGKTKVGGENFIRGKSLNYIIVRSSPVFGRGNGARLSFLDHLRMRLNKGERIDIPDVELHSFAPVYGLIDLVIKLVESGLRNKIVHYGGLTKVTHYELAKTFARRFHYNPDLVLPRRLAQEKVLSTEPLFDYSLNSTQAVETLKIKPLLLEEGLDLLDQKLIPRF
jgi:dTDP-4-dehydrorhamnose reductase